MPAGPPSPDVAPPAAVLRVAAGRPVRGVWANEAGGLTYEYHDGPHRRFVKWYPRILAPRLRGEADRLRWATRFTAVPEVVATGDDRDGAWLVTAALPGENAVTTRWKADPRTAVRAIGEGLREMHEALPVATCPYSWSAEDRIADARSRADAGRLDPSGWHPVHQHLDVADALTAAGDPPPVDRLVVCHGDACAPNTLVTPDGRCRGHVDLGALGVADPWADLAVATWSTQWNYGPGWERRLLDAYGIDPDPDRTRYYRLLWDLGP